MNGNFCPEVEGETTGEKIRFCGIWAKNRYEWTETMLACMRYNIKIVGFFDAMGVDQMDFILNQTEMTTVVCAPEYIPKFI